MLTTNWEDFGKENEILSQQAADIERMIGECYQGGLKVSDDRIKALQNSLSQIPVLVADFDDTLTARPQPSNQANRSIFAILEKLELLLHKRDDLEEFRKSWDKINTFYTRTLHGFTREELLSMYREVIQEDDPQKAIPLNPNFLDACRILHRATGAVKIPLFILSLNSHEFIEMWFESKQEEFAHFHRREGIEIILIAIMANQIVYDSENRVVGVIQHVTNLNKSHYIPDSAIVLADVRETEAFLYGGCNVVNIEEPCYNSGIVGISIECNRMIFGGERIIAGFPEIASEFDELIKFVQAIKRKNQERIFYGGSQVEMAALDEELRIEIRKFKYKYSLLIEKIEGLLSPGERREQ